MATKPNNKRGQAALVLILMAAAALIFFAISLNWGHVAQSKAMLTIAADEAASLLASEAASYGEMQKQTYLQNHNEKTDFSGTLLAAILVIVSVVVAILSFGSGTPASIALLAHVLAIVGAVAAATSLALQVAVINPGITSIWNKMQKNQPAPQALFEQGMSTALQGSITDQVNITDYLDANANGVYGNNTTNELIPNDTIGRFAFFYSERLKMINQPDIPQVVFFADQLEQLINGQTCAQNAENNYLDPNILLVGPPTCPSDCLTTPGDPACQTIVKSLFQLSDPCTNGNPCGAGGAYDTPSGTCTKGTLNPNYNPYCDPCCQPLTINDPYYDPSTFDPLHPNPTISLRPPAPYCDDQSPTWAASPPNHPQCLINNPYGNVAPNGQTPPQYVLLYDPTYQTYKGNSFLDYYGRDRPAPMPQNPPNPGEPPMNTLLLQGLFPNGIYPYFWFMKDFSPEIDNICLTPPCTGPGANPGITPQQEHWCTAAAVAPVVYANPQGFLELNELVLPYTCSGLDCCINYIPDSLTGGVPNPPSPTDTGYNLDNFASQGAPFTSNAANPAVQPIFGEGPYCQNWGAQGTDNCTWIEGDNQFCTAPWPYNGYNTLAPDGFCEWNNTAFPIPPAPPATPTPIPIPPLNGPTSPNASTVDSLDDVMHTLSDFVNFANGLLNQDLGTLSADFNSWYPQAAQWIAPACGGGLPVAGQLNTQFNQDPTCNGVIPGSLPPNDGNGRLLVAWNTIHNWNGTINADGTCSNGIISNWLNNNYVDYSNPPTDSAWCMPPDKGTYPVTLESEGAIKEEAYINANGNNKEAWGDLSHVIACLHYNSIGTANDPCQPPPTGVPVEGAFCSYQYCSQELAACAAGGEPLDCLPANLGRSLLSQPQPPYDGCTNAFAQWVKDSLTLFTDELPKFTMRLDYLNTIYLRAQYMQQIFCDADKALTAFFKPCESSSSPPASCDQGGPAAQLMYARTHGSPAETLPNSVIYGWQDSTPLGSGGCSANGTRVGCAHIVKVTAFSPGRNMSNKVQPAQPLSYVLTLLPWIKTSTGWFTRSYTLTDRDGPVYVSVQRWDQNHTSALTFPNGHTLWQFMFGSPNSTSIQGQGVLGQCISDSGYGYGLMHDTVTGMGLVPGGVNAIDQNALQNAFMLNDSGDGQLDYYAKQDPSKYQNCVSTANSYLATGMESHACAEYIASRDASYTAFTNPTPPNGTTDGDAKITNDYSIKFVDCDSIDSKNAPQSNP